MQIEGEREGGVAGQTQPEDTGSLQEDGKDRKCRRSGRRRSRRGRDGAESFLLRSRLLSFQAERQK